MDNGRLVSWTRRASRFLSQCTSPSVSAALRTGLLIAFAYAFQPLAKPPANTKTARGLSHGVPSILLVSGDNQSWWVHSILPQHIVVRVSDANGAPVAGATVDGVPLSAADGWFMAAPPTNAQGETSMTWTLGARIGSKQQAYLMWRETGLTTNTVATAQFTWYVPTFDGFHAVATGDAHTCALVGHTSPAAVYCWGRNFYGQLGDGTRVDRYRPEPVVLEWSKQVVTATSIVAGAAHTCALYGMLYCWGRNQFGQIGTGASVPYHAWPQAISSTPGMYFWNDASAGTLHTCAVTTLSEPYCWGRNEFRQLGDGSATDRWVPTRVSDLHLFKSVAAGARHTCGVRDSDLVAYCWGVNESGQLGSSTFSISAHPIAVNPPTGSAAAIKFTALAAGGYHTCGIEKDTGHLYCWGRDTFGQLATGSMQPWNPTPKLINLWIGYVWRQVTLGNLHTCAEVLDTVCWGNNENGQVGGGPLAPSSPAVAPSTPDVHSVKSADAGSAHSCGRDYFSAALLYCWGWNRYGQLGIPGPQTQPTPVKVMQPISP